MDLIAVVPRKSDQWLQQDERECLIVLKANHQSLEIAPLKIGVRTVQVQEYYTSCPVPGCMDNKTHKPTEITGQSEEKVAYNLELHAFQKSRSDPKHAELYVKLKKERQ